MSQIDCRFLSRNQIKLIAVITMIIDHIGCVFFPEQWIFRFIGRVSFPLFAYLIADGMMRTRNPKKMLGKLLLFALISQLPFMLAFEYPFGWPTGTSIFMTLFLGAGLSYIYRYHSEKLLLTFPIALFTGFMLSCDYGSYGILLIFLFFMIETMDMDEFKEFMEKNKESPILGHFKVFVTLADKSPSLFERTMLLAAVLFLSILFSIIYDAYIQLAAVLVFLLLPAKEKKERPWGLMGYLIYPIHLLLFWILSCTF